MKKMMKRTLALFLCALMLIGAAPLGLFSFPAAATSYGVGDILSYGSYPQTEVKDTDLIAALNAQPQIWYSYGYYTGTGDWKDGKMAPSDYMEYTDVEYIGRKYRGVRFSQYRPTETGGMSSADNSYQDDNGYNKFNYTYWFRWEALEWRVLDPSTGLVLCEAIIDSQPYHNYTVYVNDECWGNKTKTIYANNYANSSIRDWLTQESDKINFLNTAFTKTQRDGILATTLDNSAYSTSFSKYNSASTTDKVFLLSYKDVLNSSYGFSADGTTSDPARRAYSSDYAKCPGLLSLSDRHSEWWLRTAGTPSLCVCRVGSGWANDYRTGVCETVVGVRPALRLNLDSVIQNPDDPTELRLVSTSPANSAANVSRSADLVLNFNMPVMYMGGFEYSREIYNKYFEISIIDMDTGETAFTIADDLNACWPTPTGNSLVIQNALRTLAPGKQYSVYIADGAIGASTDSGLKYFKGIEKGAWTFTLGEEGLYLISSITQEHVDAQTEKKKGI